MPKRINFFETGEKEVLYNILIDVLSLRKTTHQGTKRF